MDTYFIIEMLQKSYLPSRIAGVVNSLCMAVARVPKRNFQGGKIYLVGGFEGSVYSLGSVDSEPMAWLSILWTDIEKGVAHTMVGRKQRRSTVLKTMQPPKL